MAGDTVAVVLTHRRWRLATDVVRGLIDHEQFPAERVIVVVNGEGGLDDAVLAEQVHLVHLPENLGPAGGYRAGLEEAVRAFDAQWIYVCEDDIGLFNLPWPRVEGLVARAQDAIRADPTAEPIGGIVAYGRSLDPRTGLTVPTIASDRGLHRVDVAAWGASLVNRAAIEAGVLPDAEMFFGYEDFDFWLRVRNAGFRVLVDGEASLAVADDVTDEGRLRVLGPQRPADHEEFWRAYYQARNFFILRRRHGNAKWTRRHLLKSARRFQLAGSWKGKRALLHGLVDGALGRTGRVDRYQRTWGEHPAPLR